MCHVRHTNESDLTYECAYAAMRKTRRAVSTMTAMGQWTQAGMVRGRQVFA